MDAGPPVWDENRERVYQRSLAYREAEKGAQAAKGGEGEVRQDGLRQAARKKWRDATDHAARQPQK